MASRNDRWETAEIVGIIVGTVVPIALCVAAWWMFPPIEIFDEGGAGRARRFRSWIIGTTGALLLVVLGALADRVM